MWKCRRCLHSLLCHIFPAVRPLLVEQQSRFPGALYRGECMEVFPWGWAGGIHRNALHEPAWDNPAPDLCILKIQARSYSFVRFFPASIKNCPSPFVFFSNRVMQLMEILFFFFHTNHYQVLPHIAVNSLSLNSGFYICPCYI